MAGIRAFTNDRALQDYLLLNDWPTGWLYRRRPASIRGLACLTAIIKMINSCLPLEARTIDNPVRQLEEKNPLMRHAWLDFDFLGDGKEYVRVAVKIFEALSLGDGPSFRELVSSNSLYSTLWARPDQRFCFESTASDSASASHGFSRSAFFRIIRLDASAPLDLGTEIDQEIDRVMGKHIRRRNNPEFLRLEYSAADGHQTPSDKLRTLSIRDRYLSNQCYSDMDDRGRVTYVLRAAVRLQKPGTDGLDQVQLFTQSGEPQGSWGARDGWFGAPGDTWFLLYWKPNTGYRSVGSSEDWLGLRIEKNRKGTQDESRFVLP